MRESTAGQNHFTIAFRMVGDNVKPPVISKRRGLAPTKIRTKGDRGPGNRAMPASSGAWVFRVRDDNLARFHDVLIKFLLEFAALADTISTLITKDGSVCDISCGVFVACGQDVDFTLEPAALDH